MAMGKPKCREPRTGTMTKELTNKWEGSLRTGLISLRAHTPSGLLWIRWWTFGLHKLQGISWLAEELLASQEDVGFVE